MYKGLTIKKIFYREFFLLVLLQLSTTIISGKDNFCYRLFFMNTSWTDRRPRFAVNMSFHADGSLISETTVNKEINSPVSKVTMTLRESNGRVNTLYNATSKLCDFIQIIEKVPVLQSLAQNNLRQGNYSFSCPLTKGTYVVNLKVNPKNPFWSVFYRPKVIYVIRGGLFEEVKNKTLIPLSTYNIVCKIVKKPCDRRAETPSK